MIFVKHRLSSNRCRFNSRVEPVDVELLELPDERIVERYLREFVPRAILFRRLLCMLQHSAWPVQMEPIRTDIVS